MVVNYTLELSLAEFWPWVLINEPLRQSWQTSKLIWSVSGSAWKGRCRHYYLLLPTPEWVFQTSVDVTLLLLLLFSYRTPHPTAVVHSDEVPLLVLSIP
jgi:hypothetical protein